MVKKLKDKKTKLVLLFFGLVEVGLLVLIIAIFNIEAFNNNSAKTDETTVQEEARITEAEGKYLFSGTVLWARDTELWSIDAETGLADYAQPFSGLADFNPSQYDAWVADLECPISEEDVPQSIQRSTFEFNCKPEYLPEAAKYFTHFNLANNHSDNSGREKLEGTRLKLEAAGVTPFADPDPSVTEETCKIISLQVNTEDKRQKLPVAFCAWQYFYRTPLAGEIELASEYAEYLPVFGFAHMGAEYLPSASSFQRQTAYKIIDAGAEFVIGNSPHWVQDSEVYKGKPIFYSTGNFIFDQQFSKEVRTGLSVQLEAKFEDENLEDWAALAEACESQTQTECLESIKQSGLSKLSLTTNYDVIANDNSNQLTNLAGEDIQTFVENRLDWAGLQEQLNQETQ